MESHPTTVTTLPNKFSLLRKEVETLHGVFQDRHGTNFHWHYWLMGIGILVSACLGISALMGYPAVSASCGVIASAIFAVHASFAVAEKSEFQRIVALEAKILGEDIDLSDQTEVNLVDFKKRLDAIRRNGDVNLPRGSGMESVRRMYDDLRKQHAVVEQPKDAPNKTLGS